MATVNDVLASQTTNTNTTKTTDAGGELGKDDFLKLLITQLSNQDPLSPMDDTQFISQMAQFSALEQMKNLNTTTAVSQATSMIGSVITWAKDGEEVAGIVSSVKIIAGQPKLMVGEEPVELSEVLSVTILVAKPDDEAKA